MTVILINPNSTGAMTDSAVAAARRAAPDIEFEGWTSHSGPPAIEGHEDGLRAEPPLLALVQAASDQGAEAIIIACFDDTGLEAARAMASCPVIGIGEASYVYAGLLGGDTAIVTTVADAVPVISENVKTRGHGGAIHSIVAANVPVLLLDTAPEKAAIAFREAARTLPATIRNLIVGCAGAVTITEALRQTTSFEVLDGVTAAARLCRAFVGQQVGSKDSRLEAVDQ